MDKGANYVLTLKANHPTLYTQVKNWFESSGAADFKDIDLSYEQRVEASHHRREHRQVWAVPNTAIPELYQASAWSGLQTVVMVIRVRRWNQTTREVQFYLSSLACDAVAIGRAIRAHWGIENQLHWVQDVTFREDHSRIRTGHSPENMALLRRLAISLLNQETSTKRSVRQKAKRAAMDVNYMLRVLASTLPPQ